MFLIFFMENRRLTGAVEGSQIWVKKIRLCEKVRAAEIILKLTAFNEICFTCII